MLQIKVAFQYITLLSILAKYYHFNSENTDTITLQNYNIFPMLKFGKYILIGLPKDFIKRNIFFFLFLMNVVNTYFYKGPSCPSSYGNWIYNYLCNQCLSPLMLWFRISIRARCATLCDKVCQWFATVRWFSPGTLVFCTNKADRHDITEILLKLA